MSNANATTITSDRVYQRVVAGQFHVTADVVLRLISVEGKTKAQLHAPDACGWTNAKPMPLALGLGDHAHGRQAKSSELVVLDPERLWMRKWGALADHAERQGEDL